jgi:hypothetical protein
MTAPKKENHRAPQLFGSTVRFCGSVKGAEGLHDGALTAVIPSSQAVCGRGRGLGTKLRYGVASVLVRDPFGPLGTPIAARERQRRLWLRPKEESLCPSVFGSTIRFCGLGEGADGLHDCASTAVILLAKPFAGAARAWARRAPR